MKNAIIIGLLVIVLLTAGAIMLVNRWTEYEGSGKGLGPGASRSFNGPAAITSDQVPAAPQPLSASPPAASQAQPEPAAVPAQPQLAPPPAKDAAQDVEDEPAPRQRRPRRPGRPVQPQEE